jgi:hypothetical protein
VSRWSLHWNGYEDMVPVLSVHVFSSECENLLTQPLSRDLAVLFLNLDTDSGSVKVFGRAQSCTASRARVNGYSRGDRFQRSQGKTNRKRCRVLSAGFL